MQIHARCFFPKWQQRMLANSQSQSRLQASQVDWLTGSWLSCVHWKPTFLTSNRLGNFETDCHWWVSVLQDSLMEPVHNWGNWQQVPITNVQTIMNSQTYRSGVEIWSSAWVRTVLFSISAFLERTQAPKRLAQSKWPYWIRWLPWLLGPKWRKKIARYVQKCSGKSEILSCFTGPISPPEIKNCCRHLYVATLEDSTPPQSTQRGSQTQVGAPQLRSLRPDFAPADASVCSAFAAYHAQSGGPKNNFIAKHQASALPHLTMKRKVWSARIPATWKNWFRRFTLVRAGFSWEGKMFTFIPCPPLPGNGT